MTAATSPTAAPSPHGRVVPRATYRIQLVPGQFTFADAAGLIDYLAGLGVSHLYCSPILTARPGSTHGYDVVEPAEVHPGLGGEAGFVALAGTARAAGLGLIVDLVPNHLGTDPRNPLWQTLLAEGRHGPAGEVFDVDWDHPLPGAAGRIILPLLGGPYGEVLYAGELTLELAEGTPQLRYYEHAFPLSSASAAQVRAAGGPEAFNGTPGEPDSFAALHDLLEAQHYRLVWWRSGGGLVNYRRFFTIDDLAAVRVEDPAVFDRTHGTILRLLAEGHIDGLRIDHPDGLRDPARYLARLARATGGVWTVVEKITESGEELPAWPVAGTTGYEFADVSLGLFVDPEARAALDELDRAFGASDEATSVAATRAKGEVVRGELAADADRVARRLWELTQSDPGVRDVDERACREVVRRTLQSFDVYRTYVDPETAEARPEDIARIDAAVARALSPETDGTPLLAPRFLYAFLADVLTGRHGATWAHREVIARFQQLSGAVMAKGVEDTLLYRNRRLLALNEVGGDPERLGVGVEAFHRASVERMHRHPVGMSTTTTHDTKRGEDVRLRIAALSERAGAWGEAARAWRDLNAGHIAGTRTGPAPDPQTELLLYQTLVAVWPLEGAPDDELRRRVGEYAIKASREAGERTTWRDPDPEFEDGLLGFIDAVLDPERSGEFLASLAALATDAAEIAMVSGLAQTLLRITAPGVPDTYQGMELWGDNLVDPDNRRPVDFALRARLLADVADGHPATLLRERRDGRVKLWLLARGLAVRSSHDGAYGADSGYLPLAVEGRWTAHVVAFARTDPAGGAGPITVVPRLPGAVMGSRPGPPLGRLWDDTTVVLPERLHGSWRDCCTGRIHSGAGARLPLAEVFADLPVALLAPAEPTGHT